MGLFKKLLNPLKAIKKTVVDPTRKTIGATRKVTRAANSVLPGSRTRYVGSGISRDSNRRKKF